MKYTFLFFAILTLNASCRKTRTCECTYSDGSGSYTEVYTYATKDDAKTACAAEGESSDKTCELK